jgi:hypothetical protein
MAAKVSLVVLLHEGMEALAAADVDRLDSLMESARQTAVPDNGRELGDVIRAHRRFRNLLALTNRNLLLLRRACGGLPAPHA